MPKPLNAHDEAPPPHRIKLLLIGPANEQLVGGAVVLFRQLCDGLAEHPDLDVRVVDTHRHQGRLSAVVSSLLAFCQMLRHIWLSDVVAFHASVWRAKSFGPLVWLACKLLGKPWIFRGFGGAYDLHFERMSKLGRSIFSRTVLRANVVLMETQSLVTYFRNQDFQNIRWYANSRPLGESPARAAVAAVGARRFLFLGQVEPEKGVREIFVAAAMIAGEADIDLFGPMRGGIQESEFGGANVHWRGILPAEQVAQRIAQYDVLLLPTYYEGEGYPGVIIEAFAAGVPVIATRWRAIPEIVDDTCGLLIEPRSAESLAEAMQMLIDSPQLLDAFRAGAWQRAQRFSADVWTAEFVDIVRSLSKNHTCSTLPRISSDDRQS